MNDIYNRKDEEFTVIGDVPESFKLKDTLYQEGFQAGAASRDAEIADLKRKLANEQARDIHSCHPDCTREGCVNRRLRAELVKALAACKAKDEALESCGYDDDSTDPEMCGPYYDAELVQQALATPSDTSALEAIVKKAGEVMRERCASESCRSHEYDATKAIRALPAVTLEDLK